MTLQNQEVSSLMTQRTFVSKQIAYYLIMYNGTEIATEFHLK